MVRLCLITPTTDFLKALLRFLLRALALKSQKTAQKVDIQTH